MRILVIVPLIVSLVGCSSSGASGGPVVPGLPGSTSPIGPPKGAVTLGQGDRVRRFTVVALDPSKQPLTVSVTKPASADVSIVAHTDYGAVLYIFDSATQSGECRPSTRGVVCRLTFGILEGQHGGKWTIAIRKRSPAPARVGVALRFG